MSTILTNFVVYPSDLGGIIRFLSDGESSDHISYMTTSSDKQHMGSVSEIKEVPNDVVHDATSCGVQQKGTKKEVDDKAEANLENSEGSSSSKKTESSFGDVSDVLDLLEDKGG